MKGDYLMISRCDPANDFHSILAIINDAALAYRGVIPADRWQEPYMNQEELRTQIKEGVEFWNFSEADVMLGVMGIQYMKEVTLIRHAYVRTASRGKGIGGKLLNYLTGLTDTPLLVGTWARASWAIEFYKKHGFRLVSEIEKNRLLRTYWSIPQRQVETSVVLSFHGSSKKMYQPNGT